MNSDKKKSRPARIELDEQAGQLVIGWKDGRCSRFSLTRLRRLCPCAKCREQRQQAAAAAGQLVMLEGEAARATAVVRHIDRVGHYAIRITWTDGHDYGIYPFAMLSEMEETA